MLTRPFTRLVVAFGQRSLTQRRAVEEAVLGVLILIPFGFLMGLISSRICCKIHFSSIRSDIWTTVVVFLIGDILMEWLLPSLGCLPMAGMADELDGEDYYYYSFQWLLQSYGISCPEDFPSSKTLLSPEATVLLFTIRLAYLCLGVHLGESLCFVVLTGGIATGKSTVARLFVTFEPFTAQVRSQDKSSGNHSNKRKPRKPIGSNSTNSSHNADSDANDDYQEGTVTLICADAIAHQILLPPAVLAGDLSDDDEEEENDNQEGFLVHPKDSVHKQILAAFAGHDILMESSRKIDRLKLGSIVFNNKEQRRKLNRITHPKIMMVLVQKLLRGVFFGKNDITMADVPLLFESGKMSWLFAVTICVTVQKPSTQLERLMKRNPELSKSECQARIDSQLPLSTKQRRADIVIDNTGDLEELSQQVEQVRKDLMGRLYGIGMSLLQMLLLIGGSTSIAVSSKFYGHFQP